MRYLPQGKTTVQPDRTARSGCTRSLKAKTGRYPLQRGQALASNHVCACASEHPLERSYLLVRAWLAEALTYWWELQLVAAAKLSVQTAALRATKPLEQSESPQAALLSADWVAMC